MFHSAWVHHFSVLSLWLALFVVMLKSKVVQLSVATVWPSRLNMLDDCTYSIYLLTRIMLFFHSHHVHQTPRYLLYKYPFGPWVWVTLTVIQLQMYITIIYSFANAMQYIYFILGLSLSNCVKVNNINRFKSCWVCIFTAPAHSCIPLPKTRINQYALKISVFRVLKLDSIQKKKKKKTYGMPYCIFYCIFYLVITNMLHILQITSTDNEFCCFTSSFTNESGRMTKHTH